MATRAAKYQSPPRNMVQEVKNIVEGYSMGALRALAQDAVQNSYDARRHDSQGPVRVEYKLHDRVLASGQPMSMLTVTDRNTTGLRGPVLSESDIYDRAMNTGDLQLAPDENWAAWEAMGYTKSGEDTLGSRGQGKAAFLYNSMHSSGLFGTGGQPIERMIMLYDTLLFDHTYRLGVRLARPADAIRYPPFEAAEARGVIRGRYMDNDWPGEPIPLELEPLSEVGTRVIVPFLRAEAAEAIRSGQLAKWLQRCWWRAIQKGAISITVDDGAGNISTIGVPSWWADEPWNKTRRPVNMHLAENIQLGDRSSSRIKRIVLLYDPVIKSDDLDDLPPQYAGVQLVRHDQWVETLGASEKFGDYIPLDKRPGFRGFVEFDVGLERQLRGEESPQHDTFKRHKQFVRQIDARIKDEVRAFAESNGWLRQDAEPEQTDTDADDILESISELFVSDGGRRGRPKPPTVAWDCQLSVDYPQEGSTRVNWGQYLSNVSVVCAHKPPDERRDVTLTLLLISPSGLRTEMGSRSRTTSGGDAVLNIGRVNVVRDAKNPRDLAFPEGGKYRLKAECRSEDQLVATASRNVYVSTDPPPRSARKISADISVVNISSGQKRISDGDLINIAITVSNRSTEESRVTVTASLESLLLADGTAITLPGRPDGDSPYSHVLHYPNTMVLTQEPNETPDGPYVVLPPGRYLIPVDVHSVQNPPPGQPVAHAEKPIYVEVDPDVGGTSVPFELLARGNEAYYPIWELEPREGVQPWILKYARYHPVFESAVAADRLGGEAANSGGTRQFWKETFCAALVDWALSIYRSQGDEGRFRLLTDQPVEVTTALWERYDTKVSELQEEYEDPIKCMQLQREVVGLMLYILHEVRPSALDNLVRG